MILYLYEKCSTCQKALRFLEKAGVKNSLTIKDIKTSPPTVEELKTMLKYQKDDLKKLFNTSGDLYRELGLKDKLNGMSLEHALQLLSKNGMLVKRPFLLGKDFGLVGFKEAEWSKAVT